MNMVEGVLSDVSVANRAMVVVLHQGTGGKRAYRDPAQEAALKQQFGDEGQRVSRHLFTDKQSLIQQWAAKQREQYDYHKKHSRSWEDDGRRVLKSELCFEYAATMGAFETELNNMAQTILSTYDQLVADDVARRNASLAAQGKPQNASTGDYPTVQQMQDRLYVAWHMEPIPTAGDFRCEVPDDVKERLAQREVEARDAARAEMYGEMLTPMKAFVAKLAVPIGSSGAVFRNTLIENLNELTTRLPKVDITGDSMAATVLGEIRALIRPFTMNPDALREDPHAREQAKEKMASLVQRLEAV